MAEQDGWTSLMLAAFNGCVEVVETLLAAGADITAVDSVCVWCDVVI